jgi:ABC-type multidrug transport system fused ATPase/permease subunit
VSATDDAAATDGVSATDEVAAADEVELFKGKLDLEEAAQRDADAHASDGTQLPRTAQRLLVDLLRPYKISVWFILLAVVIQVASRMAAPMLLGFATDIAVHAYADGSMDGHWGPLIAVSVTLIGCAVLGGLLRSVFVYASGKIGQGILYELRRRLFRHVQSLSVSFHERFTSGKVISRLTSDLDTLQDLFEAGIDSLLTAGFNIVIITVFMLVHDLPFAALVIGSLIPLYLLYRWYTKRAHPAFLRTRETIAAVIVNFAETLNGMRAMQAFRRERRNERIFGKLNDEYRKANTRTFILQAIFVPSSTLIGNLTLVAIVVWGAYRVDAGWLSVGVLLSFVLYLRRFYQPMEEIAMFYNLLQQATAALSKVSGVLAEPAEVPEPEQPTPLARPVRGAIELEQVEFRYRDDLPPVLPELELTIPAGQTMALVGATGAGKSTIAKLISRFYDPTEGRVLLDGVALHELAETDLRESIVMITQDGFLFSGSVADNIAFGKPGATREEIVSAARSIGAHEFIAGLPDGYDTEVSKRGGRLSAGQRQLVGFARAFLADPAVLILDEATSSLDVPSERAVQRALRTVLASRTALIIAHRLSTVEIADRVLVLEDGRITEDGTPSSLIASGTGEFAALHESWRDSLV